MPDTDSERLENIEQNIDYIGTMLLSLHLRLMYTTVVLTFSLNKSEILWLYGVGIALLCVGLSLFVATSEVITPAILGVTGLAVSVYSFVKIPRVPKDLLEKIQKLDEDLKEIGKTKE